MEAISVGEANSEVWVSFDQHFSTRLQLLEEAYKALAREVAREKVAPTQNEHWRR
jgi:hypothetical protein